MEGSLEYKPIGLGDCVISVVPVRNRNIKDFLPVNWGRSPFSCVFVFTEKTITPSDAYSTHPCALRGIRPNSSELLQLRECVSLRAQRFQHPAQYDRYRKVTGAPRQQTLPLLSPRGIDRSGKCELQAARQWPEDVLGPLLASICRTAFLDAWVHPTPTGTRS